MLQLGAAVTLAVREQHLRRVRGAVEVGDQGLLRGCQVGWRCGAEAVAGRRALEHPPELEPESEAALVERRALEHPPELEPESEAALAG